MTKLRNIWNRLKAVFGWREAARTWAPERSRLRTALQSARQDWSAADRETIQAKCRYFEDNTGIVQRLASVFEAYTVGQGLQISPASSDPDWNMRAKEAWDRWCQNPDLNTRQTFATVQSLWARRWFVDGEIFVLLTYSPDSKRPRIQNVEAHLVKTPGDRQREPMICDGVLTNDSGRPVGYFIGTEKDGKVMFGVPKPAEFVHHIFEPERCGQYRGIPFIASVLNELHDYSDLRVLEMRAAKEEAKTVNVIKTKTGELPDAAMMRRQRADSNVVLNTGTTITEDRSTYVTETIGGESIALKPDEDMQRIAGVRPSKSTMDYWRDLKEEICIGADIPYVIVYPDSMQGTVYRGSLDMAAATFRARSAVIAAASRRVYEYVMEWEIRNNPELRSAPKDWRTVTVSTPRAPNVDVGRNSAAMIEELKHGLTNFDLVYAPLGLDWRIELKKFEEQLSAIQTDFPNVAKFIASQSGAQPLEPADTQVEDNAVLAR